MVCQPRSGRFAEAVLAVTTILRITKIMLNRINLIFIINKLSTANTPSVLKTYCGSLRNRVRSWVCDALKP